MSIVVLLIGVAMVAFGLIAMARRDWMWQLTEWSNSFRGQVSERSELWELGNIIGGVIAVAAGLWVIALSFDPDLRAASGR